MVTLLNEFSKLSPSMHNINDACATNSTSCEASILKENVELRAQLELMASKYGKLEESHVKLSSSNDDLLVSHTKLRLDLEAFTIFMELTLRSQKTLFSIF